MSVNIQAPSLKPPRVSILSSAEIISIPGDKWFGGIFARRLSADPSTGHFGWNAVESPYEDSEVFVLPVCYEGEGKEIFPRTDFHQHDSFVIYATDDCSTFGSGGVNFLDRAKQKLAVNEPWTLERLLWNGNPGGAGPGFSFVESDLPELVTGAHPLAGFALLDSTVAKNRHDGRGMIHMTTKMFDLLQQYTLFRREGNVWFSPNDNIVVPGRGYTGDGPDDETASDNEEWMFGHPGVIEIVRSDVSTFPETPEALAQQMDRARNDLIVFAERVYAIIIQNGLGGDETDVFSVSVDPTLITTSSGGGGGGGDASAANQVTGNNLLTDIETAVDGIEALLAKPTIVSEPVTTDEAIASANWLWGWSVWNTAAGLTEITIHNGTTSAGPVLVRFRLAENESYTAMLPQRLPAPDGVHFEVVSGTAVGSVFYEA